jgi:hypothetical protein
MASAALVAVLIVVAPALRLALVSRAELARGVKAEAAGDARSAQARYERAGRCAFPGNPYAGEALARLAWLGRAWEREGRTAPALAAAESVRGILLGTGAAPRHRDLMEEASGRVVRMRQRLALSWPEDGAARPNGAEVRETLKQRIAPRGAPALAGMLCFGLAVLVAARVPRHWARFDGARPGLMLYGLACLLLVAALFLWYLA